MYASIGEPERKAIINVPGRETVIVAHLESEVEMVLLSTAKKLLSYINK